MSGGMGLYITTERIQRMLRGYESGWGCLKKAKVDHTTYYEIYLLL